MVAINHDWRAGRLWVALVCIGGTIATKHG
jgi:hypothetical protein